MNRNELAKEFSVWPWDVDDWLLLGCPAKKIGMQWEFNIEKVKFWLRNGKIKIKPVRSHHAPIRPRLDRR